MRSVVAIVASGCTRIIVFDHGRYAYHDVLDELYPTAGIADRLHKIVLLSPEYAYRSFFFSLRVTHIVAALYVIIKITVYGV
jgi:hypothetical protein